MLKKNIIVLLCVLIFSVVILPSCTKHNTTVKKSKASSSKIKTSKDNSTNKNSTNNNSTTPSVEGIGIKSPTTGLNVTSDNPSYGVMIENYVDARPQTGLDKADIVYEALAEGGITRFIAIFHDNIPSVVGPVRSARPYFVSIAQEWGINYVHVGGSNQAISDIKNYNIPDFDAMHMSYPFFIDPTRKSPHSTYIDLTKLTPLTNNILPHFQFKDEKNETGDILSVTIPYNKSNMNSYKYDSTTGHYLRYINDVPHVDRITGKQLYADNIIIQYVHTENIGNTLLLSMDMVGKGNAEYIINNRYYEGYWIRDDKNDITHFFYNNNGIFEDIVLKPGKTWINIVPDYLKAEIR